MITNIKDTLKKRIEAMEQRKKEKERLDFIKKAHSDWISKEEYFNFAVDSDLVDYAIYDMEASKLKYIYLLKKMKEEKNM